jgi:phosphatidylglycerol lysyltransferase
MAAPWQIVPGAISTPQRRGVAERIRAIPRGLTRIPVTLVTVGLLLLAGILTGTLFAPADPTDSAITSLEFGLPAFREGRVWTLFTGAVTFTEPEFYLFVGVLLAVGLGLYERRVGSLRAAFALVVTHSAGIVIPALLLWPFVDSNWNWASTLGGELDAGLSAGGFGVAAAATALLTPPWRGRLRVLVTTFLTVLVLKSGLLLGL